MSFSNKNFKYYFFGSSISNIGNGMQFTANAWLALKFTGEASSVGWIMVLTMLPNIVLAPFIGVFVDRIERKFISVAVDVFRFLILSTVTLLFLNGYQSVSLLYVMTGLLAIGDRIYSIVTPALVREIVSPKDLLKSNSLLASWNQIGYLLGATIGSLILYWYSGGLVFFINAITFLISATYTQQIKKYSLKNNNSNKKSFFYDIKEGFQTVSKNEILILTYLIILGLNSTVRTINVLLAPFIKEYLNNKAINFGIIDACFAVGAVLGNYLLIKSTRKLGDFKTLFYGVIGVFTFLIFFSMSNTLLIAMICYLFIGINFQSRIILVTLAQSLVNTKIIGRVESLFALLNSIFSMIIYLIMGYGADLISTRWMYIIQAIIILACCVGVIRLYGLIKVQKKAVINNNISVK